MYTLDVGGGAYPRAQVVLDIHPPVSKPNADYVVGDACHFPFRSNSFKIVVSYGAVNYFSNDAKFLEEVKRVLRSDGILILSSLTNYCMMLSFIKLLGRNPAGALKLALNAIRRRYRWYTLKGLANKVESAKFKVVRAYPNVLFPWRPTTAPYNILVGAVYAD